MFLKCAFFILICAALKYMFKTISNIRTLSLTLFVRTVSRQECGRRRVRLFKL